jgi:putative copper resistance protein D
VNPGVLRIAGPAILASGAALTLVTALALGGGATPLVIADAGPVVRWALPAATLTVNLAAAVMVGSVVLALFALAPGAKPFETALGAASTGAAVFTVAAAATGFLTFLSVFAATPTADPLFGEQLGRFLTEVELGRTWLITTIGGAVVTVLLFAVRGWTTTFLVALLALATLVPMGTQGHAGDLASHDVATTATVLHILGAAVWLGGLVLVVLLRPVTERRGSGVTTADVVSRYSSVALVAFVVVAVSGVLRAAVSLPTPADLLSPYGAIVLVKAAALVGLGALGWWYRIRLIPRLRTGRAAPFWTLVAVELAMMGVASGAAVALSRTPPPGGAVLSGTDPASILTGAPLPPEPGVTEWLTRWSIDPLWALVAGFGIVVYLLGVRRLRRRGDAWPVYRTVLWILGMLLLLWVTSGPINAYQDYLFSMHMLGHMLLTMAIPMLLVPGAPITLALRTVGKRRDGTRGVREWLMWGVHSPFARIVTHPLVAAALFVGSLWVFYYTDLFRWSLYDHLGHEWMVAHFLITGYLFVMSIIGIDPVPLRFPYPFRLLTLIAVMAMHAFFGIAIMMQTGLMAAEWFGSMGRTWGPSPLEDQYVGGGIAWSIGEIPTLILGVTVAIQWSRSDDRLQRRRDRHADRTGDRELAEYNERLARLAARDADAVR